MLLVLEIIAVTIARWLDGGSSDESASRMSFSCLRRHSRETFT